MHKELYSIAVVTTVLLTEDMKKSAFPDAAQIHLRFSYLRLGLVKKPHDLRD